MKQFSLFFLFIVFFLVSCDSEVDSFDTCGNGIVDFNEECDQNNFGGLSCQALGYYGGHLSCDNKCESSESDCVGYGYCGDNVLQSDNESCDGDKLHEQTCDSLGYDGGELSCSDNCKFDISQCTGAESCGDGSVQAPEQCDTVDLNGKTCADIGDFTGGALACGSDCRFDTSGCYVQAICGDALVQGDEKCDSENLLGKSCGSLGFEGGVLKCGSDCQFDTSECEGEISSVCGDEIVQLDESCDGDNLNNQSCSSLGYTQGILFCNDDCTFDESQCENTSSTNNPPQITNLPATESGSTGETDSFQVTATDPDSEQTLSWSINQNDCSFTPLIDNTGLVSWTCGSGTESCEIEVNVSDNGDPVMSTTGLLTVQCNNSAPEFTTTIPATALENVEFAYEANCTDPDGATLTIDKTANDTCGGTLSAESNGTATYLFTPGESQGGSSCQIALECSDGDQTATQSSSLTIVEDNQNPEITNLPATFTMHSGDATSFQLEVVDDDNPAQTITWSISQNSCSFTPNLNTSSGQLDFTCGEPETCSLYITAEDSGTPMATDTKILGIQCSNTNPTITSTAPAEVTEGQVYEYTIICTDADNDPLALQVDASDTCDGTLLDYGDGTGNYSFTASVSCIAGIKCTDTWGDDIQSSAVTVNLEGGNPVWIDVSTGGNYTCGIKSDNTLWCWGLNSRGQLGNGSNTSQDVPILIGNDWVSIDCKEENTCGLKTDGSLYCWGYNGDGQIGDGSTVDSATPVLVNGLWSYLATSINSSNRNTCAKKSDNTLWCWGLSPCDGETSSSYLSPVQSSIGNWVKITSGTYHTCGIKSNQESWCWGLNSSAQLGDGTDDTSWSPIEVDGYFSWKDISAGGANTCGIKSDDTLWCWGSNFYGQIGNGTTSYTPVYVPVEVDVSSYWKKVYGGSSYTCGIKSDDTLWCWGANDTGQLGNGNNIDSYVPVEVEGSSSWVKISTGGAGGLNGHTCGIKTDNTLWCWGYNVFGQLGIGNTANSNIPVQVD